MPTAAGVRLADVRCPVAGCGRRWLRAEVSLAPLLMETVCKSARCHGALRTVLWHDGHAILIEDDARPDAQSAEPLTRRGLSHGDTPRP